MREIAGRKPSIFLPPGSTELFELRPEGTVQRLERETPVMVDAQLNAYGKAEDSDGRLVTPLGAGQSLIMVLRENDGSISRQLIDFPERFTASCTATFREYLFVAGSMNRSSHNRGQGAIFMLVLGKDRPSWVALELPSELDRPSKHVDELAVVDDMLVALDNLLIPKYLVLFSLAALPAMRFEKTKSFVNGTWEHTRQLVCGESWIATSSSSINHGTQSQHITLWSRPSFEMLGCISEVVSEWGRPPSQSAGLGGEWKRIAALEHLLLLESADGLGVIDLTRLPMPIGPSPSDSSGDEGQSLMDYAYSHIRFHADLKGPLMTLPSAKRAVLMTSPPVALTSRELDSRPS